MLAAAPANAPACSSPGQSVKPHAPTSHHCPIIPAAAPVDSPRINGSASGLRNNACSATPATDNPAPTTTATASRSTRRPRITPAPSPVGQPNDEVPTTSRNAATPSSTATSHPHLTAPPPPSPHSYSYSILYQPGHDASPVRCLA